MKNYTVTTTYVANVKPAMRELQKLEKLLMRLKKMGITVTISKPAALVKQKHRSNTPA